MHARPIAKLKPPLDSLLSPLRLHSKSIEGCVSMLKLSLHLLYLLCLNISQSSFGRLSPRRSSLNALLHLLCLHSTALPFFMMPLLLRRLVRPYLAVHLLSSLRRKSNGYCNISSAVVLLRVLAWCLHRLLSGLLVILMKFYLNFLIE